MARNKGTYTPKDYTGVRFFKTVALEPTEKKSSDGSTIWLIQCDCGKVFERKFKSGKSCGCSMRNNSGQFTAPDFTGVTIKDITCLSRSHEKATNGYSIWRMRCNLCSAEIDLPSYHIARQSVSHNCRAWLDKHKPPDGRPCLPDNGSHVNILYGHCRYGAKSRKLDFQITKAEARTMFESNCYYCGAPPSVSCTHTNLRGTYAWNGIDRIDNTKGYFLENCVPCCTQCNFAKSNHTHSAFLDWVRRVYHHSAAILD